jgi:hypothetical protein
VTLAFIIRKCVTERGRPLWSCSYGIVGFTTTVQSETKPNIKAKLITGTYTLQANRAKFNQHSVSSTFLLCKSDSEDRIHLVLHCTTYTHIWDKHLNTLQLLMSENFDRCIVDKVYSHLVYSHLVYSHLVYTHLVYTHLVYSHLVYSRKMIVLPLVYSMNFIYKNNI